MLSATFLSLASAELGESTHYSKLLVDLPPQYLAVAVLLMGLGILVSLASGVVTIWDRLRKKPSVHEDLEAYRRDAAATFATKTELANIDLHLSGLIRDAQEERRKGIGVIKEEISEIRRVQEAGFRELQRSIGRLEGKLEQ